MCNGARLPTTICIMVPVRLREKKPSKNTDPDWHAFYNVLVGVDIIVTKDEEMDNLTLPPKKTRENYELTRKFQMV
jgi:hypothetical protein